MKYLDQLLKTQDDYDDLVDICALPDQYDNSAYGSWTSKCHYVNIPRGVPSYSDSYCGPCCVVSAIRNYTALLGKELRRPQLCEFGKNDEPCPIEFLTHYIADIHQPLHVAYKDDFGGNSVEVTFYGVKGDFFGAPFNLHSIWDTALVQRWAVKLNWGVNNVTSWIKANPQAVSAFEASTDPADWANESWQITNKNVYTQDFNVQKDIGNTYYNDKIPIIIKRLAAAGIRLAKTINRITAM